MTLKSFDSWARALGIQEPVRGPSQLVKQVQPIVPTEWGAEYLLEPSFDSALLYGAHEPVGVAGQSACALLAETVDPALRTGKQRACWFWVGMPRISATDAARYILFADSRAVFNMTQVGGGGVHQWNAYGGVPATRNVWRGTTTTVLTVNSGFCVSVKSNAGIQNHAGESLIYGPFFCPANLDVFVASTEVGVLSSFIVNFWWRELPVAR